MTVSAFRAPQLDGILAPVVKLRVSDEARFERWYDPGCAEGWIVGKRADTNGSAYFGSFVTVEDAAGSWLESVAAEPQGAESAMSPKLRELFPPVIHAGQFGGLQGCPSRFG